MSSDNLAGIGSASPPVAPLPVSGWIYGLGGLAVAVGAVAFAFGMATNPALAWRALLINLLSEVMHFSHAASLSWA
jgi:hypothetical protein